MRVAILYNEPTQAAALDEADVLAQVELVRASLAELGHQGSALAVGLDLAAAARQLRLARPDAVFNLVESLAGFERLLLAVPALLESLGLPYTGAHLESFLCQANKLVAKRMLRAAEIPTPRWSARGVAVEGLEPGARVLVKSRWHHGSLNLEADCVLDPRADRGERFTFDGDLFAEEFVDGREFNLSILEQGGAPEVLPTAEILFEGFAERPRIVGYRAKWEPSSFEYQNTPRVFALARADAPLVAELEHWARACWELFGLCGYARVDFRVAPDGRPFVLEVNANPCLSPDAGFLASAARAGQSASDVVARILAAAR